MYIFFFLFIYMYVSIVMQRCWSPQGSLLGPFLFLLYIYLITNGFPTVFDNLQMILLSLLLLMIYNKLYEWPWHHKEKWSNKWAVDFNWYKTVNVDFKKKNVNFPAIQFVYNGEMINNKTRHVHLGLHLQSDGGGSNHISDIHEKVLKRLSILRLLKHLTDIEIYKIYDIMTFIISTRIIYLLIY